MRPEDSPFPRAWWGTSLDNVGLDDVRQDVGTYGRYDFTRLPSVPVEIHGNLTWLAAAAAYDPNIGDGKADENAEAITALRELSRRLGIQLPPLFTTFMETPSLQARVRSNTDSYLDLSPTPVPSPVGEGHLVRFLADSQGCIFWYLYLPPGGADHAVVASPDYYGPEDEEWPDEEPSDPSELVFCAGSFEEFLWRFWIENGIWFAEYEGTPMPDGGVDYIARYRRA